MLVGDVYAPVDEGLASSGYRYEQYTQLAGPLHRPRPDVPYQVQYRSIHTSRREWIIIRIIALALVALDIRFMYWLLFQSQYPHFSVWLWQSSWLAITTDGLHPAARRRWLSSPSSCSCSC